jgi:hypothetical protein
MKGLGVRDEGAGKGRNRHLMLRWSLMPLNSLVAVLRIPFHTFDGVNLCCTAGFSSDSMLCLRLARSSRNDFAFSAGSLTAQRQGCLGKCKCPMVLGRAGVRSTEPASLVWEGAHQQQPAA